jgi:hypothetical protein
VVRKESWMPQIFGSLHILEPSLKLPYTIPVLNHSPLLLFHPTIVSHASLYPLISKVYSTDGLEEMVNIWLLRRDISWGNWIPSYQKTYYDQMNDESYISRRGLKKILAAW